MIEGPRDRNKQPAPKDAASNQGRPARKTSEVTPVKSDEDNVLETYEQSPERPGGDERSRPMTPDGIVPERERATPD